MVYKSKMIRIANQEKLNHVRVILPLKPGKATLTILAITVSEKFCDVNVLHLHAAFEKTDLSVCMLAHLS